MKKLLVVLSIVLFAAVALTGCTPKPEPAPGGQTEPAWRWERAVEFVIPWGPGSGTDTTMRAFEPFLSKELGVPVRINNVAGAGGISGAEYFARQPADGYTYSMFTQSHVIAAVGNRANFDIAAQTIPVATLVHDTRMILAGKHVPFKNFEEMVDYAKANPGRLTISVMSIAGLDGIIVNDFMGRVGIELTMVGFGSQAEADAAILGGHVDMSLTTPIDGVQYIEAKLMSGVVVFAEERTPLFPDVPTTVELGYNATIGPWRGLIALQGAPDAAIQALSDAIKRATENPGWEEWKASVGLTDRQGFRDREAFKELWDSEYAVFKELMLTHGWIK